MAANTYTPDVSTLTVRRELNRRIAIARGWRVTRGEVTGEYRLTAPDGSIIVSCETEQHAWDNVPTQPADDNAAAFELLADTVYDHHHAPRGFYERTDQTDMVRVYDETGAKVLGVSYASTFAQAAAIAWWSAFGRGEGE